MRMASIIDMDTIESLYEDYTGEHMNIAVLDKDIVRESISRMIADGALIIASVDNTDIGFVAGYMQKCLFSKDVMFSLMYFFVKEEHRNHSAGLLKVLEALLKKNTEATKLVVSSPAFGGNEKLDRWYTMQGFKPLETHFFKELN